jgi:ketosteroid isomerase-like protein
MKFINRSSFIFSAVILISIFIFDGIYLSGEKTNGSEEELIKADKKFSEKSIKEGIASAFIAYADEDVILMRDKQFPIIGKKGLEEYYSKVKKGNAKLEWTPVKAVIANSGELGYTFGNWIYTAKDTVYGSYVTIWKKQKDGSWKFILDGGNTTPPPVAKD